jgi:hypothetical protein
VLVNAVNGNGRGNGHPAVHDTIPLPTVPADGPDE